MIAAVPEYVEVCTTCQQEFQHDRRGCCPYCGTPLVEERR
jgi:rRNA maturation endonuclease Nob1